MIINGMVQKEDPPICPDCGCVLEEIRFTEEEYYPRCNAPTGRVRTAVDYLYCPCCLKKVIVDGDYHATPWRYRK